jgi:hypothetical protein
MHDDTINVTHDLQEIGDNINVAKVSIGVDDRRRISVIIDELIAETTISAGYPLSEVDYEAIKERLKNHRVDNVKMFTSERFARLTIINMNQCHSQNESNVKERKVAERLKAAIEDHRRKVEHEEELLLKCTTINNRIDSCSVLFAKVGYVSREIIEIKKEFENMEDIYSQIAKYASGNKIVNETCSKIYHLKLSLARKCASESWARDFNKKNYSNGDPIPFSLILQNPSTEIKTKKNRRFKLQLTTAFHVDWGCLTTPLVWHA